MNLRAKLLIVFVACAAVPLLGLSILNYVSGARAVGSVLREDTEKDVATITRRVEAALAGHEHGLLELTRARPLQMAARGALPPGELDSVRASLGAFFAARREHFQSLTLFDAEGGPVFRLEGTPGADGPASFQSEDFVASALHYDSRIRDLASARALYSPLTPETYGTGVRLAVPVFDGAEEHPPVASLVAELSLDAILQEAAGGGSGVDLRRDAAVMEDATPSSRPPQRAVIALDDETGRILYHTNGALMHQPVTTSMPFFGGVAEKMRAGASGAQFYDAPDGDKWFTAFKQIEGLTVSLAVAEDYTAASAGVRRDNVPALALAGTACLIGCALLLLIMGRAARRIERVTAGTAAIARGDFDQHIELRASGVTGELADNFNRMSEHLRELIAREAESKQFESFMRLSAMLTHDLKNAITGLSMLVSNMEKQFHREEFRADAVLSLREATEKLNRIVARLSEPVKSLSGEYRRAARPADLVAVIRRVLAANAEPYAALYKIETHLPDKLVATFEPERVEAVVVNLVINALEAMGAGGGTLTIEAGREGERFIFFSVGDTGVGMSAEFIRDRLFHPFATTKSRGIGLGLFTCREIVEAHGGRISVESKLGAGTRFRIVLPSGLSASGDRPRAVAERDD